MSPAASRSFSELDMNQSSAASCLGMMRCSMRKVASISLSRPSRLGTSLADRMRSARSNATPARLRMSSLCICAITWSVRYMNPTNAAVAGSMRNR